MGNQFLLFESAWKTAFVYHLIVDIFDAERETNLLNWLLPCAVFPCFYWFFTQYSPKSSFPNML